MLKSRRMRACTLLALSVVAVGCEGGTAPDVVPEFDTEAALADYDALEQALSATELQGFRALNGRTPFGGSPTSMGIVAGMITPEGTGTGRTFALDLVGRMRTAHAQDGPLSTQIISNWTRGATFVYDPEADDYRLDVGREGAPETGVRFILYEVNEAGRPIVEEVTGYADLVDEGDNSVEDIVLRLIVVQGGATVLDYRTTLDINDDGIGGALTVRGYLLGDEVRLDFDIEAVGTEVEGQELLDVAFELRVDQRDFSISGSVSGIDEGTEGEGHVEVTVQHRSDSIRIDMQGENGRIEGTLFVNGDVFATVSGPADSPTFLGHDGQGLSLGEFLVLGHIFDTVEDVFDLLEDLLDPVDDLVFLGIIL